MRNYYVPQVYVEKPNFCRGGFYIRPLAAHEITAKLLTLVFKSLII